MKLAQAMLVILVSAAAGSAFAQEGVGQGPPRVVRAKESTPGKAPQRVKATTAPKPARIAHR